MVDSVAPIRGSSRSFPLLPSSRARLPGRLGQAVIPRWPGPVAGNATDRSPYFPQADSPPPVAAPNRDPSRCRSVFHPNDSELTVKFGADGSATSEPAF